MRFRFSAYHRAPLSLLNHRAAGSQIIIHRNQKKILGDGDSARTAGPQNGTEGKAGTAPPRSSLPPFLAFRLLIAPPSFAAFLHAPLLISLSAAGAGGSINF